jgi:H+/Cl- antiporter ClcA
VSEATRIGLRLLGVLLFLIGLAAIVLMVVPGPSEIADWMGENCAHRERGPAEQCTVWDVIDILWVAPILLLVGGVMMLALRPEGSGPATIDLSRRG